MGTNSTLFKIGALLLLVQNAVWLVLIFASLDPAIAEYILYVDIAGFALLGLGYLLTGTAEDQGSGYTIGGVMVIGWVGARVYWQFIAISGLFSSLGSSTDPAELLGDLVSTLFSMIYAFLAGAVLIFLGAFFIWRASSGRGFIFFFYALTNVIGTFLFTSPFLGAVDSADVAVDNLIIGFFIKALLVPVLGVLAFLLMFMKADVHLTAKS